MTHKGGGEYRQDKISETFRQTNQTQYDLSLKATYIDEHMIAEGQQRITLTNERIKKKR